MKQPHFWEPSSLCVAIAMDSTLLKSYISTRLESITDVDADVLADYIVNLLSETSTPDDLMTPLEDFLGSHTSSFVHSLFQFMRHGVSKEETMEEDKDVEWERERKRERSSDISPRRVDHRDERSYRPYDGDVKRRRHEDLRRREDGDRYGASSYRPSYHEPDRGDRALAGSTFAALPTAPAGGGGGGGGGGGIGRPGVQRCRDYDEKGYCMRGDLCPYEHSLVARDEYDPERPHDGRREQRGASSVVDLTPGNFGGFQENGRRGGSNGGGFSRGGRGGRVHHSDRFKRSEGMLSKNTLVVEKIPDEACRYDVVKANFEKFGTIASIEVDALGNSATVRFESAESATAAHNSPDSFFNNRFVKVFFKRTPNVDGEKGFVRGFNAPSVTKTEDIPQPFSEEELQAKKLAAQRARSRQERLKRILQLQARKKVVLDGLIRKQRLLVAKLESNITEEEKKAVSLELQELLQSMKPTSDDDEKTEGGMSVEQVELQQLDRELALLKKWDEAEQGSIQTMPAVDAKNSFAPDTPMEAMEAPNQVSVETVGTTNTTEDLKKQLEQLRAQAASLGIQPDALTATPAFRGGFRGRGRGRGAFVPRGMGRGRGVPPPWATTSAPRSAYKLDLRPKVVVISNISPEISDQLESHAQYAPSDDTLMAEIEFATRQEAEQFVHRGAAIEGVDQPLQIAWKQQQASVTPSKLQQTRVDLDEEDEGDMEDVSWKR